MKIGFGAHAGDCPSALAQEYPDPPPLDPLNQPPLDRYCDVILTGGVTDGVVYPWALIELARAYRFKNIGGTSVGALAAALTAAAEYNRRRGHVAGFNEVLLKLPRKLGEDLDGMTRLFSLFQPDRSTRRLFGLFVGIVEINRATGDHSAQRVPSKVHAFVLDHFLPRWTRLLGRSVSAVLCPYRQAAAIGALAGLSVGAGHWWLGPARTPLSLLADILLTGIPCAMAFGTLLIACTLWRDLTQGFLKNGFGLCTGYRSETTPPDRQSLIEWLHEGIQGAADKPLDRPLTFKDLWDAPGGPVGHPLPPTRQKRKSRSIDLRMVTTNLTHGRPYGLPLDDETSRLYYLEEDLKPYFPAAILDFLRDHSIEYVCKVPDSDPAASKAPNGLRELPAGDLPIVVAARLSLSFPVLFSAVPLWAIDYEPVLKDRTLRRCWFSDGGICSNFPVHLFDSALPQWPTFGIALGPRSIFRPKERTWLPQHYNEGRGDHWDRFGDATSARTGKPVPPANRLVGFAFSIVGSAKDWKDKTSMRMPGVRDRVVRVALKEGEAGLNLKLTQQQILRLASNYGLPAGQALVKKFIGSATGKRPSRYWDEHRWVRFNSLLVALRERIEAISVAAERTSHATPLSTQIAQALRRPPLSETGGKPGKLLPAPQADDLQRLLAALEVLESRFALADLPQPYTPLPTPNMRIRPPL